MLFYPALMTMAIALADLPSERALALLQTPDQSIENLDHWLLARQGATASNLGAQTGSSNSYISQGDVATNASSDANVPGTGGTAGSQTSTPMAGGGGGGGGPRITITPIGQLTSRDRARLERLLAADAPQIQRLRTMLGNSPALSAAIPSINSVIAVELHPDGRLEAYTK